jgi:nucleotide-binding universal stress UspA family protein
MKTVIVGVEQSPESMAALNWARAASRPEDRVVAVHSWDVPVYVGYEGAIAIDPHELEQAASESLDRIVASVADRRVVPMLVQGPVGRAIVDVAEGADLVVVGHRGSGKVSLVLGSTANYVVHHTKLPVVVVRGGGEHVPVRHVVVGVDEPHRKEAVPPSVRALQWAASLPGVERIDVTHSWFLPAVVMGRISTSAIDSSDMDNAASEVIRRAIDAAGAMPDGVLVEPVVARGTPGFALIEASRHADLVVVGSRGHGGFTDLVLGSTTLEIAAHAHCPVAIVR